MPRSAKPGTKPGTKAGTSPTVVLLVRHGQTPTTGRLIPGRARGLHLADEGRHQADAVAERIAPLGAKVAAVYASPLERTRETARPIARALGLRVRTERGLVDFDTGDWTGQELKTLSKRPEWKTVQWRPSVFRFPGGESFAEGHLRICSTLDRLAAEHAGGVVVAVSHADPIRLAVANALGAHLDLFQRVMVSPCSVSAITYSPAGQSVLFVNSTGRDLNGLGAE
ncbi:MAG: MSMEG_4193 family putative phosphomutase [Acidimicrobiales bacterium]